MRSPVFFCEIVERNIHGASECARCRVIIRTQLLSFRHEVHASRRMICKFRRCVYSQNFASIISPLRRREHYYFMKKMKNASMKVEYFIFLSFLLGFHFTRSDYSLTNERNRREFVKNSGLSFSRRRANTLWKNKRD